MENKTIRIITFTLATILTGVKRLKI